MRILWLHADNFKCFKTLHLPEEGVLPEGLIIIEGPNSAGKSSLFDVIYYALFYDPQKDKQLGTKDDLIKRGEIKAFVELAFEIDNRYYLVQKEHGKDIAVNARLYELDPHAAEQGEGKVLQQICQGLNEVNEKLSEIMNIDRNKALRTLIVRQGEVQQLAEAKGSELRDIIYKLFQLDYYKERTSEVISFKIEQLEDEIEKNRILRTTEDIEREIESLKAEIEQLKADHQKYNQEKEEIEKEIQQLPNLKDLQKIQDINKEIEANERQINNSEESLKLRAKTLGLDYPVTSESIDNRKKELSAEIDKLRKEREKLEEERNKILSLKSSLEKDLDTLKTRKKSLQAMLSGEKEEVKCEVCEQEIDRELAAQLLEKATENIPRVEAGIKKRRVQFKQKTEQIQKIEQNIGNIQSKVTQLDSLSESQKNIEDLKHEKDKLSKELEKELKKFGITTLSDLASKYGLKDYQELYNQITSKNAKKATLLAHIKNIEQQIEKNERRITKLEEDIKKNKEKEKAIEEYLQEIDLYREVKKYVEGFIAEDIVVNRLLAGIQQTTSDHIYQFTGGQYNELYLDPTKQKTLSMSIKDELAGFVKSQQYLSGGDKSAIGLGLRIGICELLKRIRPMKNSPLMMPRLDILMLDEPLAALDEKRRMQVVEGLKTSKFSQVFLITHTDVKTKADAPLIHIEPSKRGSRAVFYPKATTLEAEAEE